MKFSISAALLLVASTAITLAPRAVAELSKVSSPSELVERAGGAPDVINVNIKNLEPEDRVYDVTRRVYYQSNLYKGRIAAQTKDGAKFNVEIPGVSSSGNGAQQMAGLSLDSRKDAKALYAVAKDAGAFRFDGSQSKTGPCSFHKFNLPVDASSKPAWSVYFDDVQKQFQAQNGVRPFGNVASAQGTDGSSYVIFALGAPAIAKVSADGKTVTPWYYEAPNGSQRPGFTGVTYVPEGNLIVAFGGPRPLTAFKLDGNPAKGAPIFTRINGNFGSLDGTEKIKTFPSLNGSGSRLVGAKTPNVYAFTSTDNYASASFKTFSRPEIASSEYGLTSITEGIYGGIRNLYASGAYFGNGAKGGRTNFPMYHLDDAILN
ncbi:hypothetical protein IE81DRAFT_157972 [Ceraceosorus guamensis]|uniref:Uncharacterized protein n=1 Tax=Ceraceosorus guamensis TaxID=1522189 RepID=A0A316VVR0_9BASI|nr:hypothetical protein IE81DRAFT_157972 [Ceraceosorus guamensis]PWN41737.1 hypothetical protein IE81DRAFT_157972 [Ceraceosorus guamensis]